MMIPDFIGEYHHAAPDDYCDRMIERFEHLESTQSAWRGEEANGGVQNRKDFSFMFERDADDLAQETNTILDGALKLYIADYPSVAIQEFYSRIVKVQRTPPKGGFHNWHCENAYTAGAEARNLVWTIYLNDVPDGEGETEFLEFGKKVKPRKGLVCFFPSAWTHTHRGNPVYSQDKYIATGWYYLR